MTGPDHCLPLAPLDRRTIPPATNLFWRGRSFLHRQWQRLVTQMAHAQELHVWQRVDRSGRLYWQAYDPITGRSTTGSEADIRAWIEQLHYLKR